VGLDMGVAEVGQNTNGSYVRWNNGLQVCWNHFGTVRDMGTTNTTYQGVKVYRCDFPIVFPRPFSSNPAVVPTGNPELHSDLDTGITTVSPVESNIRFHSLSDFTLVYALGYIAIGWWKEPGV